MLVVISAERTQGAKDCCNQYKGKNPEYRARSFDSLRLRDRNDRPSRDDGGLVIEMRSRQIGGTGLDFDSGSVHFMMARVFFDDFEESSFVRQTLDAVLSLRV